MTFRLLECKEKDNPLVYNALKVCGNLTDKNFKELSLLINQTIAKENLDYEIARSIKGLAPILLDGNPTPLNFPYVKWVWEAKEPLIKMLADQIDKNNQRRGWWI